MSYQLDEPIKFSDDLKTTYIVSSHHRKKGNPNKSIWKISNEEEVICFMQTIQQGWIYNFEGWGLKISNGNLQVIGENNTGDELKIAKFVDGNKLDVWHGYPADYMLKPQDRPTTNVLKSWVNDSYITKAKMSKIRSGQSCNL